MGEIKLSISLLVSGREDTTEKCLNSLQKLLTELPSELILVDTGCSKELRKKLLNYTQQIVDFTWCNDFAKARNTGLSLAKGEWFLFLDDDEWFEDVSPIIAFFQSGEYQEYHQAVYKARNYSKLDGSAYVDEWVSRMIRVEEDTRFEGRVHEALVPTRGKCKKIDAFVHHFGYAFPTEEARIAHKERNVKILETLIAEEPDNMRWRLQILQEHASTMDAKAMQKEALSAIALVESVNKPFVNQCRGAFYSASLLSELWLGHLDECLQKAQTYLDDVRNTDETICSLCKFQMDAMRLLQAQNQEEDVWNTLADCGKNYLAHYNKYKNTKRDEQAEIIAESILFVKDNMSENIKKDMELETAIALAEAGRSDEISSSYIEELVNIIKTDMDGNGEFLSALDAYWALAKSGVLPLEEILLSLPFSQWMVQVLVLEKKKSESLWDEMRMHLMEIQTREDIRYDYFHAHAVNDIITRCAKDISFEDLSAYLQEFAQCNLKYAENVYTEEAFAGDMEMVEENGQAAIWIAQMFECDAYDWSGKLDCLKKSALVWPALGDTVKVYAKLLGQEQEKQNTQAKEATDELKEMTKQIKIQVDTLIQAGQKEEALAIVRQLRQMLPEDKEFAALEKKLSK